ncbi:hypothetical protein T265_00412 [Opisthorchis viverrini]|uniref:Uncharacterized protein n=1 Tax=Opisthorchis viverrini TaxID=6198 RepID=A0A075AJP1_OPIVI|nr:hypothetical protein T265_00412 [Opisthorchis viverrini]KER33724.1 hypothetical protein T265_00412 [Opisthorchis viverrini]
MIVARVRCQDDDELKASVGTKAGSLKRKSNDIVNLANWVHILTYDIDLKMLYKILYLLCNSNHQLVSKSIERIDARTQCKQEDAKELSGHECCSFIKFESDCEDYGGERVKLTGVQL